MADTIINKREFVNVAVFTDQQEADALSAVDKAIHNMNRPAWDNDVLALRKVQAMIANSQRLPVSHGGEHFMLRTTRLESVEEVEQ